MEVSVLSWGYPQLIQSLDHDLVWKAMVTWGSPVFGKPPYNTRFRKPPYVTSPRYGENLWDDDLLTVSGQQVVSCSSMLSLFVNTCQLVWILPLFRYMICLLICFANGIFLPRNHMIFMATDPCSDGCWNTLHEKSKSFGDRPPDYRDRNEHSKQHQKVVSCHLKRKGANTTNV